MAHKMDFLGLVVSDVAAATEFYTQKLGLELNEQESIPNRYAQFKGVDGAIFALLGGGFEVEGIDQTVDIGLLVADADAAYTEMHQAGVEMLGEPHDMPFGRTFLARTPDGHVLRFYAQPS